MFIIFTAEEHIYYRRTLQTEDAENSSLYPSELVIISIESMHLFRVKITRDATVSLNPHMHARFTRH